ncbi:MAG: immune inhibitor A, partial [Anaerolineales bacterium]|nr:immune inhibitor A [Anaerolineales bacterium]
PPVVERRVRQLPFRHTAALPQFGVHYLDLPAAGAVTLSFAGDTVAPLFPPPPGAATAWFAPTADESNAQLTLPLDLTGLQQATLTFDAWYDLEEDWDFAYLQVSTDGGATWELLRPAHDTRGEYGPAWNGRSAAEPDARGGWVPESVSLDAYAGGPVLLRIDVLTDSAITGQGVALANLQVPEMPPTAGWPGLVARGFVETGPLLPQAWQLRLIHPGATPRVETLPLDDWNQGTWTVELGPNGGVLVITTATPFVADTGDYWLDIR